MNRLIEKIFESPLGQVICGLESSISSIKSIGRKTYENGQSEIFRIEGYKIELIEFKIRQPLYNGEKVTDSQGWIWRIEKIEATNINLKLVCELTNYHPKINFDTACGEYLDAIEAYNSDWKLNIGTEDGEIMNSRAEMNDWFPSRLQSMVDFHQSITKTNTDGFETKIPNLEIGESLHIQFLTAYDKSNSESTNTWLAVDESKRKLENWIGLF